ncbi:pyridoxal phosphate-dependent aminotransferase [Mesoterricola sediminis]|uniref:Aminotransferase n=1 Tax=Mesoterricola sediminis TaxID=2927980 RepID=A0AA48KEW7_9BACT|nr:pyridoxal phosphate-dependent aminotransferase [Mesoterricola sediminis]BDU78470.1 aminotransferase [Mesoterricola sediminis]
MLRVSERATVFPDSPIRKLVPYADQARALGRTVYPLNIGQPDIPTPRPFLDALKAYDRQVIAYGKSEGEQPYREALAKYYAGCDIEVSANDIVVTQGGSEAILFAFQVATEPGDEVLVFEPFYTNYNAFALMCDISLRPVRTLASTGFHLPPDEAIRAAIGPRTKAILVCTPNNPTGTVFTEDEMRRLGAIAKDLGLFLISDEVYREFCYEGVHTSVMHLKGLEDNAILVDSVSKRYSACGARIGCLVTRNRDARAAAVRLAMSRLCPASVEQEACLAMAQLGMDFFAPLRDEYRRRRDATYEGLMRIPGVTCLEPKGAFYIMAELPVEDCESFAKWLLTDYHHDNSTVMVAPGPGFYARGKYEEKGQGLNQVRLAYVLETPKLKAAMDILGRAVDAYMAANPS